MSILGAGEYFGKSAACTRSSRVIVTRLEHQHGWKLPMHVHEGPFFSMVLRGGYREETGRMSIDYEPLTIVYHPPGTAHVDEIGPGGARFLMVEAAPGMIEGEELPGALRAGYPIKLPRRASWAALGLLRDGEAGYEELTFDLLATATRTANAETRIPGWVARVLDRVRDEFTDPPTTAELARSVGVHPVHLARVVRRETGSTLADLVRQRRIEKAVALMGSDDTLASIASAVGFSDQAHFTRDCRRVTGLTPSELRRRL